jgi:transcription antitermination factor NusG
LTGISQPAGELGGAPVGGPAWFACYTRSRHEKRVDTVLRRRGFGSFLPLVQRESMWKDRRKIVAWPLFPGYVFGHFRTTELHAILAIPGVATVVRSNDRPAVIHPHEIENVRRFAAALARTKVEPDVRPFLAEGQRVRIQEGPFRGVEGMVVERRSRRRVLVGLEVVGQGLELNVAAHLLEPVAPPAPGAS